MDTLIIYVHGAFASKRSWNYVQKQVNRSVRNKASTYEVYFEYDLQEEDAFIISSNLSHVIREALKEKSPKKLLLVGHSFGGVLAVAASRELALENPPEMKVITMASPFGGARIATLVTMFTPSATFFNNVSHNSHFMWNFKSRPLACPTHSFVTTKGRVKWIAGENDGVVSVESQMHFRNDPHNTIDIASLNHFEVLLSDNIASRIISEVVPLKVAA